MICTLICHVDCRWAEHAWSTDSERWIDVWCWGDRLWRQYWLSFTGHRSTTQLTRTLTRCSHLFICWIQGNFTQQLADIYVLWTDWLGVYAKCCINELLINCLGIASTQLCPCFLTVRWPVLKIYFCSTLLDGHHRKVGGVKNFWTCTPLPSARPLTCLTRPLCLFLNWSLAMPIIDCSVLRTPCLKKLCKLIFCQNFVKFRPIAKIFGTEIAKRTSFSGV